MKRRRFPLVGYIRIRSAVKQDLHDCEISRADGLMKRRDLISIPGVDCAAAPTRSLDMSVIPFGAGFACDPTDDHCADVESNEPGADRRADELFSLDVRRMAALPIQMGRLTPKASGNDSTPGLAIGVARQREQTALHGTRRRSSRTAVAAATVRIALPQCDRPE